ncbi:HNH endonuclease [Streptomyces jumonjinensis]|uniref:HNH endonuclease n=1 Tax=Streptomyces jumonjinensis TaxID=1945 RepID=UPI0037AAC253
MDTPHGPRKCFEVKVERPGRKPLVGRFGGFPLRRQIGAVIHDGPAVPAVARRRELVGRLLAGRCELCGRTGEMEVHHVAKLTDLAKLEPNPEWAVAMVNRRRKSLVLCTPCHTEAHAGKPSRTITGQSLESDVR